MDFDFRINSIKCSCGGDTFDGLILECLFDLDTFNSLA